MPQLGLHLSFALLAKKQIFLRSRSLQIGFLWGSILPDMDFAVLIPVYFFDRSLALSFHRNFSHGLLIPITGIFIVSMVFKDSTQRATADLVKGFFAGIILHVILDIFMWFAPVSLFWPFKFQFGITGLTKINDWAWNLVFACEPLAYAIFLYLLSRTVSIRRSVALKRTIIVLIIMTAILITIGQFIPRALFEVIAYTSAISVGFTSSMYFIIISWKRLFPKSATNPNGIKVSKSISILP